MYIRSVVVYLPQTVIVFQPWKKVYTENTLAKKPSPCKSFFAIAQTEPIHQES